MPVVDAMLCRNRCVAVRGNTEAAEADDVGNPADAISIRNEKRGCRD